MESFYRTHCHLVEHTHASIRRGLMDEIDWNDRLIGIKGTRGVGKTTFLLQYAKENGNYISLGTDAHYCEEIGDFTNTIKLLNEIDFPKEKILNCNINLLQKLNK